MFPDLPASISVRITLSCVYEKQLDIHDVAGLPRNHQTSSENHFAKDRGAVEGDDNNSGRRGGRRGEGRLMYMQTHGCFSNWRAESWSPTKSSGSVT